MLANRGFVGPVAGLGGGLGYWIGLVRLGSGLLGKGE